MQILAHSNPPQNLSDTDSRQVYAQLTAIEAVLKSLKCKFPRNGCRPGPQLQQSQ
jgi:hypothetical protein